MGIMKDIFNNTRKPQGFLGKMMVHNMNTGHLKMAQWGTHNLPALTPSSIIDLGCGGGRNAEDLMKKYPAAAMTAVDYSEVSTAMSEKRNADAIKQGRCKVLQADVSALPVKDCSYDLATAFETVYFWPGPLKSFKEVSRILKPGGHFLIVNEFDGAHEKDRKWVDIIDGMAIYSEQEILDCLKEAGFTGIRIDHNKKKHWICFLAVKA